MCGLVGIFSFTENVEKYQPFIKWSLATMKRRGPDSNGIYFSGKNFISGFNRLSIRDLSNNANQPMESICGNYVLCYNGEIYNTDEIKSILRKFEINYKTNSDTEILLYALIHLDIKIVLELLDGIFAFSFFNKNENSIILARDRAGVKPLYYGTSRFGIVFSSQYDHIINHPYFKDNSFSSRSISAYLQFGYMVENYGIIKNTKLLEHGNYIKSYIGNFKLNTYWSFPLKRFSKTQSNLEDTIEHSVKSQLVSDVNIGTYMSGGIDSTLVTYFANSSNLGINSYNISQDDIEYDEGEISKKFANIFNTNHKSRKIDGNDLINLLDNNFKAFSEPFADYSSIPTMFLSDFSSKDVTVALSGDGGDELFWGYPRNYKIFNKIDWITAPKYRVALRWLIENCFGLNRKVSKKELIYNNFFEYYFHTLFISGGAYWVPKLTKQKSIIIKGDNYISENNKAFELMRKLEFDFHLQRILIKVDRSSMFYSQEVRVPLLSKNIINKSLEYSIYDCIKDDQGKLPLKFLLSKFTNKELVNLPKKGFSIPIDDWVRTTLKKEIEEKLYNSNNDLSSYIDSKELRKMLEEHFSGTKSWGWMIWAVYSLIMWHDYHYNKYPN